MADVFVSYSRRDSGFVRRLAESVSERGKEVWLDTQGIADGEVFPEAIKRAIEQSDGFVFVITPNSVDSPYCDNEVEYARELQKRIVPVLRTPVPDSELPPEIRDRNWIPFTDDADFDPAIGRLLTALDTDLEAAKAHTRWLVKALDWDAEGRDKSFLLRGSELHAAETWLASRPEDADPAPTQLQREYLLASRNAAARRQRGLVAASGAVAVISIGLLVFALISRGQAVSERVSARAQALAAESQAQLPNDPEISLILGTKAVRQKATPQTRFALRAALDASPLELGLPTVAVPRSCALFGLGLMATYSPDGRQIAEVICNGSLRLLDAATGRLDRSVRVARGASSVVYSPDGDAVAVGTGPGVSLVNPHTGALIRRMSGVPGAYPAQTLSVAFSPNGQLLAATSPAGVTVWTVPAGRARKLATTPLQGSSLAFSPDGRQVYTGGLDGLVRVFDVGTGRELRQIDPFPPARGQSNWPLVVATSHDGRRLAVAYPSGGQVGVVSVYSTTTWRKQFDVMTIPDVQIQSLGFSPDDTRLAVGAEDGTAGVWSLVAREQLVAYDGPTAAVTSMSFSPDGTRVLTASEDGITRVWRAVGTEQALVPIRAGVNQMALQGDSLEVLLNSARGGVWVSWSRLPGGDTVRTVPLLPSEKAGVAFLSADGRLAFVARFLVRPTSPNPPAAMTIVNAATGQVVRRLGSVVLDTQGPFMFSADDSKLILLETPSAKVIVGPGGRGAGLTGADRLVVLTLATGRAVTLPGAEPCGPGTPVKWAFSGDGRRVAQAGFCGIVDVWDTQTGHLLRQLDQGAETSAVALDDTGARVLVSSWDSRATIWSVRTGRSLVRFIGHTRGIADAALSRDGTRILTASLDRTVRVWDAHTGQVLRVLSFAAPPTPVIFSTDGSQVVLDESSPISGVPDILRVYDTCPACQDGAALLRLAQPHTTRQLTQLERTVIAAN